MAFWLNVGSSLALTSIKPVSLCPRAPEGSTGSVSNQCPIFGIFIRVSLGFVNVAFPGPNNLIVVSYL